MKRASRTGDFLPKSTFLSSLDDEKHCLHWLPWILAAQVSPHGHQDQRGPADTKHDINYINVSLFKWRNHSDSWDVSDQAQCCLAIKFHRMLKIINESETTLKQVLLIDQVTRCSQALLWVLALLWFQLDLVPPVTRRRRFKTQSNKMQAGETTDRNQCGCCFYLHSRWPDLTYGSSLTWIALKTVTRSVFCPK